MTDIERKVIEILTQHEITADAWASPIHAVDSAMGWDSAHTREFVGSLIERKLIQLVPTVGDGPIFNSKQYWQKR